MTTDFIVRNWALVGASILGCGILFFVVTQMYRDSAQGRLVTEATELRKLRREAENAASRLVAAEARLATLQRDAATVKPRTLSEAEEAVQDARSMRKITEDQVLRAKKRVGEVIVAEFSPNRQDVLRTKYL